MSDLFRSECHSLLRSPWPCLCAGCIEGGRGTDERLECARVDLLPLMDVNRAPCVPVEARVEELGRVLQRSPLGEGQLHYGLVRLAGADDPVVRPYGSAHPLPLLHDIRICLFDELAHPAQGLPAPVPELGDPFVDQLGCRLALGRTRLFHVFLLKLPNSSRMPSNNSFKRHNFSMSLEEAPNVPHYRRALLLRIRVHSVVRALSLSPQLSSFNGDNVCLDLAVHSTPPEPLADSLRRDVGCFAKPRGIAGLDLIS